MAARSKATCARCAAKKRRRLARKNALSLQQEMSEKEDHLTCEDQQFLETFGNQEEETQRLRSALIVLRSQGGSAGVSIQVLNQLHEDASNATAIGLLLDSRDRKQSRLSQATKLTQELSSHFRTRTGISMELKHLWH